jgi:4-hydroxythreonine-4-phosphate dehydrogenase
MPDRPLLAVTMGDPAGVGPEVVLKALARDDVWDAARPLVVGDAEVLRRVAKQMGWALALCAVQSPADATFERRQIQVLDLRQIAPDDFAPGKVTARCGRASAEYVFRAIELAQAGEVAAIVTGPINKAALREAGLAYRGHTEILADRCGARHVAMMLVSPGRGAEDEWLRVVHATTHVSLAEAIGALSARKIVDAAALAEEGLRRLGLERPRLAVAALNPHASDEGLMGDEEARIIRPAVEEGRRRGLELAGPIPADTVFLRAVQGEFDVVIALYHDQGHIAIKTHGFERAVNVTLGLPIVRTSVDHGTAFDIAWQGKAHETSLVEAIKLAARFRNG